MTNLKHIGVLAHPQRPPTAPVAQQIAASLKAHGIATWVYTTWDESDVREAVSATDAVIAIGGDGAMLRAARACAPYAVPVLGVNMGRLGFLTEIASPDHWETTLARLLTNDYWIEKRMMITSTVTRGEETIATGNALNDVVISGQYFGQMLQLDVYIDDHWATTYNADAIIIATPTGSTAYALSAGGPILPPDLANILVVPVAPHLSMDRPIVLSEGSRVDVYPAPNNRHNLILTVDGHRITEPQDDDVIRIRACEYSAWFVRLRERNYFYRSLLDRLEPRINSHHAATGPDSPSGDRPT